MALAVSTSSTKRYPRKERDIVIPLKSFFAIHTRRGWEIYALALRKSVDENITKRAKTKSK